MPYPTAGRQFGSGDGAGGTLTEKRWPPEPYCLAATPGTGYCRVYCPSDALGCGTGEKGCARRTRRSSRARFGPCAKLDFDPNSPTCIRASRPGAGSRRHGSPRPCWPTCCCTRWARRPCPTALLNEAHFEFRGGGRRRARLARRARLRLLTPERREIPVTDLRYPIGHSPTTASMTDARRAACVARIAAAPGRLRAAVAGLDDAQLDTPTGPADGRFARLCTTCRTATSTPTPGCGSR